MTKGFWDRGGLWVLVQSLLMGGILALGPLGAGVDPGTFARMAALLLIVVGSAFGIAGAVTMGRVRTIYPEPNQHARLISHGIYSSVRHPIYTSLIFLSFGWSLAWNSTAAFAISGVMLLFLIAKSSNEERRLRRKFPEYEAYAKTSKRLIPWIY
ncbi:isoprenylcysteine carboxylmethyltransferase family protein [Akkermansiaceae bacterium]|nr:isoprenylcysteine carboxylmethyltransferase family protein [Akkermansiaceae bacterium]